MGCALARGTTHTAALGYYTSAAAREGMAAIAFAGSIPMTAYHGARAAGVSTSPLSIAVPGGDRGALVLDMATSVISAGGLTQARRAGRPIPPGLALDGAGVPTTDPAAATIPRPLGGHKGSGLSPMIECLTRSVPVPRRGRAADRLGEGAARDGIPVSRATFDDLGRVADRFGVTMP